MLTSGNQLLPPPPPAYDSEEIQAQLTELKSITRTFPIAQQAMYWHTFESAYPYWYNWATMRLFEHRLDQNAPHAALVYSTLAVAYHDALVACFEAKYTYWFIRPSQLDAGLSPLFPPPLHPSHPAAHGCASNAAATVLAAFFPSEADEILTTAETAATTRIWAGIHYPVDVEAGLKLGHDAAELVVEHAMDMAQV